jgi:deoxyribonuclease-2
MCLSITTTEANRLATEYIIAETLTNRANSPAAFATAFPQLY